MQLARSDRTQVYTDLVFKFGTAYGLPESFTEFNRHVITVVTSFMATSPAYTRLHCVNRYEHAEKVVAVHAAVQW